MRHPSILLPAVIGLAGLLQAQNQAAFTTYGTGCGSPPPAIGVDGLPVFGHDLGVTLANARPNSPAVFVLGGSNSTWSGLPLPLSLAPLGAPGCLVLASPDLQLATATSASGTATIPVPIPNDIGFLGAHLYAQWFVVDPTANQLGLTASNGGDARIGTPPPLSVSSFTANAAPDAVVEIRGQLGSGNPDDFCVLAIDTANNDHVFMLGESLTRQGGVDILRARVRVAGPAFQSGQLMIGGGTGGRPNVRRTARLTAPGEPAWSWKGLDLPETMLNLGTFTLNRPLASEENCVYSWRKVGNTAEVLFPFLNPCNGNCWGCIPTAPLTWDVLTRTTTDIHFNIQGSGHFDCFLKAVTVSATDANGGNVGPEHAAQITDVFRARYGSVPGTFSASVFSAPGTGQAGIPDCGSTSPARLLVRLVFTPDSGYTLVGSVSGKLIVDCPERQDAFVASSSNVYRLDGTSMTSLAALGGVNALASSPDGRHALMLTATGYYRYDMTANQLVGPIATSGGSLTVSAQDWALVASALPGSTIQAIGIPSGTSNTFNGGGTFAVNRLAASPSGLFVFAGSSLGADLHLLQLNPTTGALSLVGSSGNLPAGYTTLDLAISPGGGTPGTGLVAAAAGGSARVFGGDVAPGATPITLWTASIAAPGTGTVQSIAFAPEGKYAFLLVSGLVGWEIWRVDVDRFGQALSVPTLPAATGTDILVFGRNRLAISDAGTRLRLAVGSRVEEWTVNVPDGALTGAGNVPVPSGVANAVAARER